MTKNRFDRILASAHGIMVAGAGWGQSVPEGVGGCMIQANDWQNDLGFIRASGPTSPTEDASVTAEHHMYERI
jgi:hypothetical protein